MQNATQTNDQQDLTVIDGEVVEVKTPDAALAVMNPVEYTKQLFEPFRQQLALTKRRANRVTYDITTKEGLTQAEQLARGFTKIRTSVEKAKTEAKRPIDQTGKLILSGCNEVVALVRVEEDRRYQEIDAEKNRRAKLEEEARQRERVRIEAIEARLAHIRGIPGKYAKADAATLQVTIDELLAKQLDPALYDEHLEAAAQSMIETVEALRQLHADAIASEAQAAELARLRAEDEERKAKAAAAEKAQAEAAAALKVQQDQMAAIIEVQGLAAALTAAGKSGDRAALEAALAKARAFNPAAYGAMAPMAQLARDAAVPLLEDLLANLPAPVIVTDMAPSSTYQTVTVPIEADHTGVVIGAAVLSSEAVGELARGTVSGASYRATRPMQVRPTDLDMVDLVAHHYDVPSMTALDWLASFDAEAARIALSEA